MDKKYNANEVEKRIQKFWKDHNIFKFHPQKKPIFSVDTPPPTISGMIHVGHTYSYSQAEFVVNFWRMNGYNVFYPMGFDDNGLPSEQLAEKNRGIKAEDMDRNEFIKIVLEETKKGEEDFRRVWERLGLSVDWSLLYRTIEPRVQRMSQLSFLELYKIGRIYQKEDAVIWCPYDKTAISQVELQDKELESSFVEIDFELVDGKTITIATTRPELLPACVAVFVHPNDEKHKNLIGKKVIVPIFKQKVPIMADQKVNPEKGTGIVMCCTFGDITDIEWFRTYRLPLRKGINERGIMTDLAGKYRDLPIKKAREAIKQDLKEQGLLRKEQKIVHTVNVHERCEHEVEFLISKQWFIKILDLKKKFLELGDEIKWYPEHMKVRYQNWINGLQWDWVISRQRYFGVPFPVWYCKKCKNVILADEKDLPIDPLKDKPKKACDKCGSKNFEPEKDVLDTWATSSLTPLINARWKENDNIMDKIFPMGLRPQAHDIITFWAFNTVVKSYLHSGKIPFKNIMISGHGLDPKGKKMSKSKGNIVEPLSVIARYSADALRWWAASSTLGSDAPYQEKDVVTGQKVLIKLWNASRFAETFLQKYEPRKPAELRIMDRWILSKLMNLVKSTTEYFKTYEYSKAKTDTEVFFWHAFADNYLEIIKHRLYLEDDKVAKWTLYKTLLTILKLLTPFIPHVTEAIYQELFKKHEKDLSITISKWPEIEKDFIDKNAEDLGDMAISIVSAIRQYKSQRGLALNKELSSIMIECDAKPQKDLKKVLDDIKGVMKIKQVGFGKGDIVVQGYPIRLKIVE